MGAAFTVIVVVSVSFVIIRIATSMLVLTGMARETARFQARSAFLGVGYTTSESESIVDHPIRRRIAMWLMWLGNAGIVSVVGSIALSFGRGGPTLGRLAIIVAGLLTLGLVSRSQWVERAMSALIERGLRRFAGLDTRDYAGLLHVRGGWNIDELGVREGDWLAHQALDALELRDEGVIVLGIERGDGDYVGAPHGDDVLEPGDTLVLYGRRSRIVELDERRTGESGDAAHTRAVADQDRIDAAQP